MRRMDQLDDDQDQDQQHAEPSHVYIVPDPPCVGCPFRRHCGACRLACRAFAQYAHDGRWFVPPGERVPDAATFASLFRAPQKRQPSKAIYQRLFSEASRAKVAASAMLE